MKISVIVCTYNRPYAIVPCLDSIAQSLAAAPVEGEIIVVDNASTDDTAAVIKKWAETCAFPVQALYEPKKGISAARNCGIRAARGELLAFTDDDCRMSKEYVTDALRHDAADTAPVLRGGRVELGDPTDLPLTIMTEPLIKRWEQAKNSAKCDNLSYSIFGCNMSMRQSLIKRIGFFDENIGAGKKIAASEDIDYIFRSYLAQLTIEYVPDMIVYHFHGRKTNAEGKKLLRNYAIGEGALYAKYAFKEINFCRQFYWDLKNALREIIYQENLYLKNIKHGHTINFCYKEKVLLNLLGAIMYILGL